MASLNRWALGIGIETQPNLTHPFFPSPQSLIPNPNPQKLN
ncbi:MAG: hypothetical protein V7K61_00070 [Nostoc sp.]